MRVVRIIFTLAIIWASVSLSFSQDQDNKAGNINVSEPVIKNKVILMLPFYNYTGSEFGYLSTYIPELLSKYISKYEGIVVYDAMALRGDIESSRITPEMFYYSESTLNFIRKLNADIALAGRYLVQNNSIIINFKVIDAASGKREDGYYYEDKMDGNLLYLLDRYAKTRADWIVEHILSQLILKLDTKHKTRSEKYLDKLKGTKFGEFVSNKWIFACIIIILFFFIGKMISVTFKKVSPRIKMLSDQRIGESGIRRFRKTLKWISILFGIKLAVLSLHFSPGVYDILNDIIVAVILALSTYALIIILEGSINLWGKGVTDKINPRVNKDLMPLFVTFSKIFIVSIVLIVILSRFDIDIGPFIASIGIMGIAIGFAVKDSLANIISGIFLAMDRSIAAGDMVTIDNDTGIIKEVGVRNTKLLTYDNEIIVIPNNELANKKFKNYVLPDPAYRVTVVFSVVYGSDVDRVEEVVINALKAMDGVLDDPEPICYFEEMADFSLIFHARFWIPDYNEKLARKKDGTRLIYRTLYESGIGIPFPTYTVYLRNESK